MLNEEKRFPSMEGGRSCLKRNDVNRFKAGEPRVPHVENICTGGKNSATGVGTKVGETRSSFPLARDCHDVAKKTCKIVMPSNEGEKPNGSIGGGNQSIQTWKRRARAGQILQVGPPLAELS